MIKGPTIIRIDKPPYDPQGSKLPPVEIYGR